MKNVSCTSLDGAMYARAFARSTITFSPIYAPFVSLKFLDTQVRVSFSQVATLCYPSVAGRWQGAGHMVRGACARPCAVELTPAQVRPRAAQGHRGLRRARRWVRPGTRHPAHQVPRACTLQQLRLLRTAHQRDRTTFLPPEEAMDDVIARMRKFNDGLMTKYGA